MTTTAPAGTGGARRLPAVRKWPRLGGAAADRFAATAAAEERSRQRWVRRWGVWGPAWVQLVAGWGWTDRGGTAVAAAKPPGRWSWRGYLRTTAVVSAALAGWCVVATGLADSGLRRR